jgi:hypothetical protein
VKICPLCNGQVVEANVKNYVYDTNLGNITIKGDSKLPKCTECENIFVPGKQMEQWNKKLLKKLAATKRTLKPTELVFVFSVLPYDQKRIADAVGRDKTTLSKYKTGVNPPDHAFDFLLKKIMRDYAEGSGTTMSELEDAYEKEGLSEETDITSLAAMS